MLSALYTNEEWNGSQNSLWKRSVQFSSVQLGLVWYYSVTVWYYSVTVWYYSVKVWYYSVKVWYYSVKVWCYSVNLTRHEGEATHIAGFSILLILIYFVTLLNKINSYIKENSSLTSLKCKFRWNIWVLACILIQVIVPLEYFIFYIFWYHSPQFTSEVYNNIRG